MWCHFRANLLVQQDPRLLLRYSSCVFVRVNILFEFLFLMLLYLALLWLYECFLPLKSYFCGAISCLCVEIPIIAMIVIYLVTILSVHDIVKNLIGQMHKFFHMTSMFSPPYYFIFFSNNILYFISRFFNSFW